MQAALQAEQARNGELQSLLQSHATSKWHDTGAAKDETLQPSLLEVSLGGKQYLLDTSLLASARHNLCKRATGHHEYHQLMLPRLITVTGTCSTKAVHSILAVLQQ